MKSARKLHLRQWFKKMPVGGNSTIQLLIIRFHDFTQEDSDSKFEESSVTETGAIFMVLGTFRICIHFIFKCHNIVLTKLFSK